MKRTVIFLTLFFSNLLFATNEELNCDDYIEKQVLSIFLAENPQIDKLSISSSILDGGFILLDSPDQLHNQDNNRTYLSYVYETNNPSMALATYYILRKKDSCDFETINNL